MTDIEFRKINSQVYDLIFSYFSELKDKGGNPYLGHLYSVANMVDEEMRRKVENTNSSLGIFYKKAYIVALCHDILEDTDCPIEELNKAIGGDTEIFDAIVAITRRATEDYYFDFIERIKKNDIARLVKIYDLQHNMDVTRLSKFDKSDQKRIHKYWHCWKYLKGEMGAIECNNNIHKDRLLR